MAPKSKKPAATGSACITDFFPRRERVTPTSSQKTASPAKLQRPPPRPDQEVISVSSTQSHITVSSSTSKSIITVSDTSSFAPGASVDPMESISSRRCPASKQPPKHASTSKAKRKSESEFDPLDAVGFMPISPTRGRALAAASIQKPTPFSPKENLTHQLSQTTHTRKKPRISSPEPRIPSPEPPTISSDADGLVPSSQSDEDELICRGPPVDPEVVMEDVDRWRNDAGSPVSLLTSEYEGDVDMPDAAPSDIETSAAVTPEPSPEAGQQLLLLTPLRPHKQPSLATTPVALTEASKAAQIIADIKAKAYANTLSSPDDSPLGELKELEDSSDEEELFPILLPKRDPFSSPLSPVPAANRYALRDRGGPSTSQRSPSPSTSRRTRGPPPRGPVILTKNREPPKKSVSDDPLGALLREKRRADKGGDRDLALRRAEEAIRAGPSLLYDTDEADPQDEDVAANSSIGDMSLNEEDRVRLLGEKQGEAVVGILQSDRAKSEDAKGKHKVMGVLLWEGDADHMNAELSIPSLPDGMCESRVLAHLKSSIDFGDLSRAALVLSSGVLGHLNLPHEVTAYLCDLALSPRDTGLTLPAFYALSQIWGRPSTSAPPMSFRSVLSVLVRLGAKHSVLGGFGWAVPDVCSGAIQVHEREAAVYRLTRLLALSVRSTPLSEAPDFVLALLLVGLDPTSSPDLQRDLARTIDLVCRSLAPDTEISVETETYICNRVIGLASDLDPINQVQIVGLLSAGSGRTARIARWVAHAILTQTRSLPVETTYNDHPPLVFLLELALKPQAKPKGARGIFEIHDDTDYVDLCFHVQMLATAVSDVEGYARQETVPSSPKETSMLTAVRDAIEGIHGRIIDTRAAHLDRSRAKGALKQLSMRVHYQYQAALRSRQGKKKSRPIQQYFAK